MGYFSHWVVERLLTPEVQRFLTFTSHIGIIHLHLCLSPIGTRTLMLCPGHPGHWVVERPCCLSAGAADGRCHARTLFWTTIGHSAHTAHTQWARGYRFMRFIPFFRFFRFFRFWFLRFTDERLHHWNLRDAIQWSHCCYLLLWLSLIDCLGPRGRNSFVKHMKSSCNKQNKRCCTKLIQDDPRWSKMIQDDLRCTKYILRE